VASGLVKLCYFSDQIQSTCEILKRLMLILDPVESLHKYHESINLGLSHPVTDVRALVVAHVILYLSKIRIN